MDLTRLTQSALFSGISQDEAAAMLKCLGAVRREFPRDSAILRAGEPAAAMGLVLSGRVNIESDDIWGNRSILESVPPGQVFGEAYASLPGEPMMVSAVAAESTAVLFLDVARVLRVYPSACGHHARLVSNLLSVMARKNLTLTRRMFHTAPKSIRGRLLSYLSFEAMRQGQRRFEIPFNRQQLADYLEVDRSALSAELSKMRREGLLECRKNCFFLNQPLD